MKSVHRLICMAANQLKTSSANASSDTYYMILLANKLARLLGERQLESQNFSQTPWSNFEIRGEGGGR